MTIREMILGGGGAVLVLMTIVQLTPIKIDPWTALARAIGRAINGEVLEQVGRLEQEVQRVRSLIVIQT